MKRRERTMDQAINDMHKMRMADETAGFQVGDRVSFQGQVGTIDRIDSFGGANMYCVRFNIGRWAYRATQLKRAN